MPPGRRAEGRACTGVTLLSLVALTAGPGRAVALTAGCRSFLLLSVVALAGMAAANVLLPSLVKLHFPSRIGLLHVDLHHGAGDRAHRRPRC